MDGGWEWLDWAIEKLEPGESLIIGTDEGDLLLSCGVDGSLTIVDMSGEGGGRVGSGAREGDGQGVDRVAFR